MKFIKIFGVSVLALSVIVLAMLYSKLKNFSNIVVDGQGHQFFYPNFKLQNYLKPSTGPLMPSDELNYAKKFNLCSQVFCLNIPVAHPMFHFHPKFTSNQTSGLSPFAGSFKDSASRTLVSFEQLNAFQMESNFQQKVFQNIYLQNLIQENSLFYYFNKLFSENIDAQLSIKPSKELFLKLFILHLRFINWDQSLIQFGVIKDQMEYFLEYPSIDKDYKQYIFIFSKNNNWFAFRFHYRLDSDDAIAILGQVYQDIVRGKFQQRHADQNNIEENSSQAYEKFKNLTLDEKKSSIGFFHLYQLLLLSRHQEEVFKQMVFWAEKGELMDYLEPLYLTCLKKYGKSFSKIPLPVNNEKLRLVLNMEKEENNSNVIDDVFSEDSPPIKEKIENILEFQLQQDLENMRNQKVKKNNDNHIIYQD